MVQLSVMMHISEERPIIGRDQILRMTVSYVLEHPEAPKALLLKLDL